jgi:hypothetical protein
VSPSVNATEKLRKEVKDLRTKKAMNMLYLSGMLKGDKAYAAKVELSPLRISSPGRRNCLRFCEKWPAMRPAGNDTRALLKNT